METTPTPTTTTYPTLAISRRTRDRLRIQAALEGHTMRDIAEVAINIYLDKKGTPEPTKKKKVRPES